MRYIAAVAVIIMFVITPFTVIGSVEDLEVADFFEGSSPGAMLGWNITSLGNVGGSSAEDYAVSAPGDDKVYIWHGPLPNGFTTSTGIGGAPNWIITGPANSDFGWSVAGIPDIDNDGDNEILIGAPAESKAYLFEGGLPSTSKSYLSAVLTIVGGESEMLGHSVAGFDYANNSNIYIAVGAPLNNHLVESAGANFTTGAVFMWNMTEVIKSGDDTVYWFAANKSLVGDVNNGMFGFTMVNLGDVNLDGIEDLGIGDPYYDWSDDGAFYIFYGKPEDYIPIIVSSAINGLIIGEKGSRFGWSTTRAGSLGGTDVFASVVVGAPMFGKGKVYIFYGQQSPIRGNISAASIAVSHELEGELDGDRFGWSVCANSMGSEDLSVTVGAPGYDNGTVKDTGGIFTFFMTFGGQVTITDADTSYIGDQEAGNLGTGVCEVAFGTSGDPNILASAANYDRSFSLVNTGKLFILERNRLPEISIGIPSPLIGNENDLFTLSVLYKDFDGDPASHVTMTVYRDSGMKDPIRTLKLNKSADMDFVKGVNYTVSLKLPNSITEQDQSARLYLSAETQAKRGSTRRILTNASGKAENGPIVDGIRPSSTLYVKAQTWGDNDPNAVEGTLRLSWDWPGEDEFQSGTITGKVTKLTLKYRKGSEITEANWNDADVYKTFQGAQIKAPYIHENWITMGLPEDIENNPNDIRFSYEVGKVNMYYFAFQAEDDQGNIGPISESPGAEVWWRKPIIPGNTTCELLDVPDDNGKQLSITWIPSSVAGEDLLSYWIFIDTEPITSIRNEDGSYRMPDFNITKDDDQFYNTTNRYIIDSYHGGEIENGQSYYAAVVPINWLGQFTPLVEMSGPETVIDDKGIAISAIKDLRVTDTPDDFGNSLTLQWTPTRDQRFTDYLIYGADYPFSDIEQAVLIEQITDISASSYKVEELSGADIAPGKLYSFAVITRDYNRHMDKELVIDGNYVSNIRAINEQDKTPEDQVDHVEMVDRPNDGGGALLVTWSGNIVPGEFWRYYIYFSDEPIESILDVEPYAEITNYRVESYEINQTVDGEPLVDGRDYYVVVTIEDFNDNENTDIIIEWPGNNYAGPVQPVNQSDFTPPPVVSGLRIDNPEADVNNTWFRIRWTAADTGSVPDFNRYIITYWEQIEYPEEIIIEDIDTDTWVIEDLTRGTLYWFNISVVDDNGNRGDALDPKNVTTTGLNQAPYNLSITVKHEVEGSDELFQVVLSDENPETTIKMEDIAYSGQLYFVGMANDDYTIRPERMEYYWNLTTPDGQFIVKSGKVPSFNIPIEKEGTYIVSLVIEDDEGEASEELVVTIEITKEPQTEATIGWILLGVFILLLFLFIAIGLFVWISGRRSAKKEQLEKYEERKKDIEAMEPIYTNLPTWSCSCGQTKVKITDDSHCSFCLESFEGVPINGIDQYLADHDLVLTEMRIAIPIGWQGQDKAIDDAEKELEERKERALHDLEQEYASVLDIEVEGEGDDEGDGEPLESLQHRGAIIPGQMPPPAAGSPQMPPPPTPGQPQIGGGQPTRIIPPGAQPPGRIVPPGQPGAQGPIVPPRPGQPRPPYPPQQQ
ncbi:MAG: hypothetical protein ACMUIG_00065 [Thermoplasmatota archaeon]